MNPSTFRNESPADFSRPEARSKFETAVKKAKAAFAGAKSNLVFRDRDSVAAMIAEAKAAFGNWSRTSVQERAALLFRAADLIRQKRLELAAWILVEVGKSLAEADADVCEAVDFLEYYGREALRIAAEAPEAKPLGVVAVIAPWNFPLAILTGMTAAALATGNTAIMKPAEQSPVIGKVLFDLFREAGVPDGVLHFLPGTGETVGDALVRHPDVALVCFTGSKEVGAHITNIRVNRGGSPSAVSGKTSVKQMGGYGGRAVSPPVIMETGGKNAIIVDETADLEFAAEQAKLSAFGFQGQKCSACSRILLLPKVYEPFKERFLDAVSKIRVGDPADFSNLMGPVIDDEATARITHTIEAAEAEHSLIYRGEAPRGGRFIGPTVFENAPSLSRLAQKEIFGPVVALMKARDLSEALEIANEVPYDLTGGFFSRDRAAIERVKAAFEVGNLYINRKITGALVACQPFGGYRLSSLGFKAGGPEYLWQFLDVGRPLQVPPERDLPSVPFQPEDSNKLIYIKEGHRLLGKTISERRAASFGTALATARRGS